MFMYVRSVINSRVNLVAVGNCGVRKKVSESVRTNLGDGDVIDWQFGNLHYLSRILNVAAFNY